MKDIYKHHQKKVKKMPLDKWLTKETNILIVRINQPTQKEK